MAPAEYARQLGLRAQPTGQQKAEDTLLVLKTGAVQKTTLSGSDWPGLQGRVTGSRVDVVLPASRACAHAMRAEYRDGSGRDLAERFDADCAFGSQIVDDMLVVDDFVPDINRRAVLKS